jgi:hypothetical protein
VVAANAGQFSGRQPIHITVDECLAEERYNIKKYIVVHRRELLKETTRGRLDVLRVNLKSREEGRWDNWSRKA